MLCLFHIQNCTFIFAWLLNELLVKTNHLYYFLFYINEPEFKLVLISAQMNHYQNNSHFNSDNYIQEAGDKTMNI